MVIAVGAMVMALGATLRWAATGSTAGVSLHDVGMVLLVIGAAELAFAVLLRLPQRVRVPAPQRLDQRRRSDNEHRDRRAA
jgi:hypothetical protein